MELEVRRGSRARPAGRVVEDEKLAEDMRLSRRTVAALADEGLFALEREEPYRLAFHFTSADDWQEFLDRPKTGTVVADPALLDSAFARGAEGRIVAVETGVASVLARRDPTDRVDNG